MLAEIFIVRLEAAARLQEQTASLSSSPFVPFTPSNQFVLNSYSKTGRLVLLTGPGRLDMSKSRSSDWPAVFFVLLLFAALLAAFMPSSVKAH